MKLAQVAAQLYTVRDHARTPADIVKTLKRVRQIGYTAVQVSGIGPVEPKDLKRFLDEEGLKCVVTHEPGDLILNEPRKIIEKLDLLDCKYTAYPYPSNVDLSKKEAVLDLARRLDESGRAFSESGKALAYHNHNMEFRRIDGVTVLDMIYSGTDARYLKGEPDVYWIQAGGADPAAWCAKLAGRLPLIHLKDMAIDSQNKQVPAEIGRGNMDFSRIVQAADAAGCEWFIVEQDSDWISGDPFESLKQSYEFIRQEFVTG